MSRITGFGISVDLPTGWEAEIYHRPAELAPHGVTGEMRETTNAVCHVGDFPLPPDRGDFGSGAVEIMRANEVLIVLFEYNPDSAGTTLFERQGMPTSLAPDDFSPDTMQRPLPGQAGMQRFFSANGRAFCLYVVLGSYADREALVPRVNTILETIEISTI